MVNSRERRGNLVIKGVKEEANKMGTLDNEKVKTILDAIGYSENLDMTDWEMRRLDERKKRPMPVKVSSQRQQDGILRVAKNLKEASQKFT